MARGRLISVTLAVLVLALAFAAAAPADNYRYAILPADQAIAKTVVLKHAELPNPSVWKGGTVTADRSSGPTCTGQYEPKESDLTITGLAETKFTTPGAELETEAGLFKTAAMERADWRRSNPPALIACLRKLGARAGTQQQRFVSVQKLSFPRIGGDTFAFRTTFAVTPPGGRKLNVVQDTIIFERGRGQGAIGMTVAATKPADLTAAKALELHAAIKMSLRMPAR
jgi:hypothetical protein